MASILFKDNGKIKKIYKLVKHDIFRTPLNTYHTMIPLTKFVIYHESKIGPFLKKMIVFFLNGIINLEINL